MTQPQQNRLTMNKAVATLNRDNEQAWTNLAAFVRAQNSLLLSISERDKRMQEQSQPTTGITEDKDQHTELAVSKVLAVARNTAAYALEAKDRDLYARVNYAKSYLMNLADNAQIAVLHTILDAVQEQLGKLGDYNVTATAIADARQAVDKIDVEMTKGRQLVTGKSTATLSIPQLEAMSRQSLAVMDRLIHNFTDLYPKYVQQYRQARIILDLGRRHEDDGTTGGGHGDVAG